MILTSTRYFQAVRDYLAIGKSFSRIFNASGQLTVSTTAVNTSYMHPQQLPGFLTEYGEKFVLPDGAGRLGCLGKLGTGAHGSIGFVLILGFTA